MSNEKEATEAAIDCMDENNKDDNVIAPTVKEACAIPDTYGNSKTDTENQNRNLETTAEEEKTEESFETVIKPEQLNSRTNRELKSLLELSKEANLDTNIAYKRKSTTESGKEKPQSRNSPASNIEIQDESGKRSMRSQNPEFAAKHKFLSRVSSDRETQGNTKENEEKTAKDLIKPQKKKKDGLTETFTGGAIDEKTRKLLKPVLTMIQNNKDAFCWRCHREKINLSCGTCPRSYHSKCLKQSASNIERWVCPECVSILTAESTKTRSSTMKDMTLEHFCGLLKFALKRMMQCSDSEPFIHPVNTTEFPDYKKYIVQPMDLTKIEKNIKDNLYGSTNAFEADAKWMLHNSIIFNSYQSKLTTVAKSIMKVCKQEMQEIENCPTCYLNANTKKDWFLDVCPKPHVLLWAKLKGFPYWPAKAMCTNSQGMVDVRFFGAHDRAWVHFKECFLYSQKDPNSNKQKRNDINECVKELEIHIENLKKVYEIFRYAPYRTPFDPELETKQLQIFLPRYRLDGKVSPESKMKNNFEEYDDEVKNQHSEDKIMAENELNKLYTSENSASKCTSDSESSSGAHSRSGELNKEMEGYGTDEEQDVRMYGHCSPADDNDDGNFDTQIEAELTNDGQSNRGRVRIRGGYNNLTGRIRVIPRQITDDLKRISTDDINESPQKLQRRNSDQSVKSDSSKLSGFSEKINKVNTSENMEVSLDSEDSSVKMVGNLSPRIASELLQADNSEYAADITKKPLQVNIANKEFAISPSSKCKIADRLIRKLTDSDADGQTSKKINRVRKEIADSVNSICSDISNSTDMIHDQSIIEINLLHSPEVPNEKEVPENQSNIILINHVLNNNTVTNSNTDLQADPTSLNDSLNVGVDKQTGDSNNCQFLNSVSGAEPNNTADTVASSTCTEMEDPEKEDCSNSDDLLVELYSEIVQIPQSNESNHTNLLAPTPSKHKSKCDSKLQNNDETKKRKHSNESTDDDIREVSPIQRKLIKVVDMDSIQKSLSEKIYPELVTESLLQKHLQKHKTALNTNILDNCVTHKLKSAVAKIDDIKTEPRSDEEDSHYMEAKRQYLSALNISAKGSELEKLKDNEISANSKTEENSKFKVVDNITKIIDTVASNYNDDNITRVIDTVVSNSSQEDGKTKEANDKLVPKIQQKQRARKSFPRPSLSIKHIYPAPSKSMNNFTNNSSSPNLTSSCAKNLTSKDSQTIGNLVFLTQPNSSVNNITVLPPNQTIAYSTTMGSPVLTMVQHPATGSFTNIIVPTSAINLSSTSQNYIPQKDITSNSTQPSASTDSTQAVLTQTGGSETFAGSTQINSTSDSNTSIVTNTATTATTTSNSVTLCSSNTNTVTLLNGQSIVQNSSNVTRSLAPSTELNDDLNFLTGFVPENITRAITELMCRGPPKLKPRPPGPLNTSFDPGVPSTAGSVTSYINSVSHRLTDYFRGMLVETLQEIGSADNSHAIITSLKLENESLRHKHIEELKEIKKNVNSILRDIQKSILEERERIIEETRATCEAETIKRVEEAKSKQWCANCMKEAQFYCCWNTSYCDYPCQLKHWPKHMSKCAQNSGNNPQPLNNNSSPKTQVQPLILRKTTAPKTFSGRSLLTKQAKVIMNKPITNKVPVGAVMKTSSGGTLTIVEPTPGSYELVGNGPISVGGKLVNSTVLNKIKSGNIISVTSSSTAGHSSGVGITSTTQKFIFTQTKSPIRSKSTSLELEK